MTNDRDRSCPALERMVLFRACRHTTTNRFTVQAGVPVKVVFTGWAQDCLGQPEFPELGLKGDLSSGQAVFPLGELEPGAYTFTCSMGVNEGVITAE